MIPLPLSPAADDYPPLSALNTLLFCPRRCFLQTVEGIWLDNAHTLCGSHEHQRVHAAKDTESTGVRQARGLRLVSHTLRVQGVADLVEFSDGVPFPVEYKRGKRRKWDNDEVQLCAQAICLEEMLGVSIPAGAIFHIRSKRRREVPLTPALRDLTRRAAEQLHALLQQRIAPPAVLHKKCQQCSLYEICMPELLAAPDAYLRAASSLFTFDPS